MILGFLSGIWNNPVTRWVAGIALAIIGLSIYSANQRRIGAREYKRKAEVRAQRQLRDQKEELDERVEEAIEAGRSSPRYDDASSVRPDIAELIFSDRAEQ